MSSPEVNNNIESKSITVPFIIAKPISCNKNMSNNLSLSPCNEYTDLHINLKLPDIPAPQIYIKKRLPDDGSVDFKMPNILENEIDNYFYYYSTESDGEDETHRRRRLVKHIPKNSIDRSINFSKKILIKARSLFNNIKYESNNAIKQVTIMDILKNKISVYTVPLSKSII